MKRSIATILNEELNLKEEKIGFDTLEERIEILNLSNSRVKELENEKIKTINSDIEECKTISSNINVINADEVVGLFNRPLDTAKNWLELLGTLHKKGNFEEFKGKEKFQHFMLNYKGEDLPIVIKVNNEYYIEGNGKHRLTIAKCLGGIKVKVSVKTVV